MGEGVKQREVYISFTSIPARLPHILDVVRHHCRLAVRHNLSGVCLALQEDAVPHMPEGIREMAWAGDVELLTAPKDHGSNTKWTLARKAHPDATLIVVDDDRAYPDSMVADLLGWSWTFPGRILCRALRMLAPVGKGEQIRYSLAKGSPDRARLFTSLNVQGGPQPVNPRTAVLEHWAGMLYPPGFPDADPAEAAEKAPHDDDVFVTAMASRSKTGAELVPTSDGMLYTRDFSKENMAIAESALGYDNRLRGWSRTQDALNRLREDFF